MNIILTEQQVKNLFNRLKNKITTKDNQPQQITQKQRYEKVKADLIKFDNDPRKAFAEGKSLKPDVAKEKAIMIAQDKLMKKMGKTNANIGTTSILSEDEFYFQTEAGQMLYHVLIVITAESIK